MIDDYADGEGDDGSNQAPELASTAGLKGREEKQRRASITVSEAISQLYDTPER